MNEELRFGPVNLDQRVTTKIVPITIVSAHVLIYDDSGPRSMFGGVCPLLASALAEYADTEGSGVTRRTDVLEPLGQDIFDASYAAVMRLRGLFSFLSYQEIDKLHEVWPESFKYAFVVSR